MFNVSALHTQNVRFTAQLARTIDAEMNQAGTFAQSHVRDNPRGYKHRTGNLIQKTGYRIVRASNGRVLKIRNTAPYAAAIDRGSKPHIIRPRKGKLLRFMGRGGSFVFARMVRHPGTRATHFLYRATMATGRVLGPNLIRHLERDARRFNSLRIRS